LAGTIAAIVALGCFVFGMLVAHSPRQGVLLIGALAALLVFLTRPQLMVWIALFLAFASLPAPMGIAKMIGPLSVRPYQVAAILAICALIPIVRPRFSAFVLPGILFLTVMFFTATGIWVGNPLDRASNEALLLCELIVGYVLALLIVQAGYVKECTRVMAVVLWFSAGMLILSSLTGLELAARIESLAAMTGSTQAIRYLTATQMPATAVLAALIAGQILGRSKSSAYFVLGLPAAVILLLAFSRNHLIALGGAAGFAFLIGFSWSAVRRSAVMATVAAGIAGIAIPGSLLLLQKSEAGAWLADQITAFSRRVLGGVSESALSMDQSTLDRLHENENLQAAIADAPLFGHGLGYAYQRPFGKPAPHQWPEETFTMSLGTTYAHNFYLWWLVKAGAVGMAVFAVFALTPMMRALRSASVSAQISAAVCAGLLAVCVVSPLPLNEANSMTLGMALGAMAGFAGQRRRAGTPTEPTEPAEAATPRPSAPKQSDSTSSPDPPEIDPGQEVRLNPT